MINMMNKIKGFLAVMMTACMLLTMGGVSSDAEYGIKICGEAIEKDNVEVL